MKLNNIYECTLSEDELRGEISLDIYPEDDLENYPAVLNTNKDVYYYENQNEAMQDEERILAYQKEIAQ